MIKAFLKKMSRMTSLPLYWWWGATLGMLIALIALCALGTWNLFDSSASIGNAAAFFVSKITVFILLGIGVVLLMALLEKVPSAFKCVLIGFIYAVYYFFIPIQTLYGVALISLCVLLSFSFTGGGVLSLLTREKGQLLFSQKKAWISIFIGVVSLALLVGWLWLSAVPFMPPHLSTGRLPVQKISLSDPAHRGPYAVSQWFYGSGNDLHRPEYGKDVNLRTETVDGSSFVDGWSGVTGWLRTLYWGFDSESLPLNGHVWMPEGKGPFPLVLIVHGNHEMMTPSDSGYGYLGELFASRGFITVSVDENFLNGSWLNFAGSISEVPARGWLLLEHLQLWRAWNEKAGTSVYAKVDMENIGLIGHSRGGEAIGLAAAFNKLSHFPGDGNITFDYNFNIKALAAISPVDAQYKPGGIRTELDNIDYFVIHGSQDGDVRSFEGSAQYHRVHFDDASYHFKAALYVYGANHGQFNSLWGEKDESSPATVLFDIDQIMPAEEQQTIAKVYLSAFFEVTLRNQVGYMPMFRNYRSATQWLPKTLYLNEFADSTFEYVIDDKEHLDIAKTSLEGGQKLGENLDVWRQTLVNLKKGRPLRPVTFLGWKRNADTDAIPSYRITLPSKGITTNAASILVLSLANADDDKSKIKKADMSNHRSVDFTIELTDDHGQSASVPLSDYAYLHPPLFVKLMKASFLDPYPRPERVFQTFEYPLSLFVAKNPQFDPEHLHTIRLVFDKTPKSKIILDTIAFERDAGS